MLESLFGGKKEFTPVFPDGQPLIQSVGDVPKLIPALANSFKYSDGSPANIENHWLYTGTSANVLDQVRFGQTIGIISAQKDVLDRIINVVDQTYPSIAVHPKLGQVGMHLVVVPSVAESGFMINPPGAFVADQGHLVRDRVLARYLNSAMQQQVTQAYSKPIDKITDQQLAEFILNHPDREETAYVNGESHGSEKIVYIPRSMTANIFATEGSYHPTRAFLEPAVRENRFDNGELLADGHIHQALTEKRIAGDPWLSILSQRYGPVKAASTLSIFDAEQLMGTESLGKNYGLPAFQDVARELYIVDDNRKIVGHSVLNVQSIMNDDDKFKRFDEVTKKSLSSLKNADLRLAYHDMIQDFTTQKGVNEPLASKDYCG